MNKIVRWIMTFVVILILVLGYYYVELLNVKRQLPATLQKSYDFLGKNQHDSSVFYAKQVINEAWNTNNKAYANSIIGYSWWVQAQYDSSLHYYKKSLEESMLSDSTDFELQATAMNMIGIIFQQYELHKKAIEYLTQAVDISELHQLSTLKIAYFNLASNQSKVNDIRCVKSYYKALELASNEGDQITERMCLSNLGNLMLGTDNFESAKEYFKIALSIEYSEKDLQQKSFVLQGLGEAEYALGEFSTSEKHLNESLDIKISLDDKKYIFSAYLYLARFKESQNDLQIAESNYKNAIKNYPYADLTRQNISVFKELSKLQSQLSKEEESEQNNLRYYQEIDNYLDAKEKAAAIAAKDEFNLTVTIDEAQYRKEHAWMLLDQWDKDIYFFILILSLPIIVYLARKKVFKEFRMFNFQIAFYERKSQLLV